MSVTEPLGLGLERPGSSLECLIGLGVGLFFKLAYGPAVWMFFPPENVTLRPAASFEILGRS